VASAVLLVPADAGVSRANAVAAGAHVDEHTGVVCTAVAMLLMFYLVGHAGASRAAVITYINPAVAALIGVWLLHERLGVGGILAFVLILFGSWLATRSTGPQYGRGGRSGSLKRPCDRPQTRAALQDARQDLHNPVVMQNVDLPPAIRAAVAGPLSTCSSSARGYTGLSAAGRHSASTTGLWRSCLASWRAARGLWAITRRFRLPLRPPAHIAGRSTGWPAMIRTE